MKLWKADLSLPFLYDWDSNFNYMLVKSMMDNGWFQYNPYLGAPGGQYLYDFPQTQTLDMFLIKIIAFFL